MMIDTSPIIIDNSVFKKAAEGGLSKTLSWINREHHIDKGVYLRIAIYESNFTFSQCFESWIGGDDNRNEEGAFVANSAEKLLRLFSRLPQGDSSSFQSKVTDVSYAGAIKFILKLPNIQKPSFAFMLISVSGLSEMADESVAVETACLLPSEWQIEELELAQILGISNNSVYKDHPQSN